MIKLKTLLLEIEGTEPNVYYHITLAKNVPSIKKTGLMAKKKAMWHGAVGQDIRQAAGVFVFDNYYRAMGWAFKLAWDKPNDKSVILKLKTSDTDFIEDPHWETTSRLGKSLVKQSPFKPQDLVEVIPFEMDKWTPELTMKINSLKD